MIKIQNLCKSYGENQVFDNFNLKIEKGKITCILGESGSGKTTLLNVLSNLTEYTGEIITDKCSMVFQKPNLFPSMTAIQNLTVVNSDIQLAEKTLLEVGLADKIKEYPLHLSGGQAQRVALARALVYDAPVLLMDEPFSNLDLGLKHHLIDVVKKHHEKKKNTVVLVTHDINEAVSLADRIVVLSKGQIVYDTCEINEKTEKELFGLMIALFKNTQNESENKIKN